jgi:hypothetical protein
MKISTAILVCSLISITPAMVMGTTISQWTFETSVPNSAGPVSAEIGSGIGTAFHSSSSTAYSNPVGNGSSESWSADHWSGGSNGSDGDYWQFSVSTLGYQSIALSWDQISSSTGPGEFGLFYSTDDSTFTQFGPNYSVLANVSPNTWSKSGSPDSASHYSYDLSSITALNNVSTVYFLLQDMSNTNPTNGMVGTTGTDRVDNFTISGDKIPDSMSSLAGLGCVFGLLPVLRRMTRTGSFLPASKA